MLVDDVTITVIAGKGGDGKVSLVRNAQTAKGGPDGGNGGNGGDVYFKGVDDIGSLRQFRFKKTVRANEGIPGGKKNLYGKNADHLYVPVPLGTRITDTETGKTYDVISKDHPLLIARGGKGGRGNNEFKSATNQTPRYAEPGTPGERKIVRLELRLIAEVGLIGLPNAGKSSLLDAITNANPKIANYPFTTLEPNLGVMDGVVLADIPGLIEGASTGKGLGTKFLRHIERTKILLHCLDITDENIEKTYALVRTELENHNPELIDKPEIILLTKTDLSNDKHIQLIKAVFEKKNKNKKVLPLSIYDDVSLELLKTELRQFLQS
jgi:GTPase